jgi:hypothetical protein
VVAQDAWLFVFYDCCRCGEELFDLEINYYTLSVIDTIRQYVENGVCTLSALPGLGVIIAMMSMGIVVL